MRGLPSPASLCGGARLAPPSLETLRRRRRRRLPPPPRRTPVPAGLPRRINFLAERRRRRQHGAPSPSVRERNRARPRLRSRAAPLCQTCLGAGCYVRTRTGGGGGETRAHAHAPAARGWNMRAGRTSRIWSTDRFRTTPSRPDRPLAPASPRTSAHSRVPESFPFSRLCMYAFAELATHSCCTAGGLVAMCSPPSPPFSRDSTLTPLSLSLSLSLCLFSSRRYRYSIKPTIWLSARLLTTPFVCVLRDETQPFVSSLARWGIRDRLPPSLFLSLSLGLIRN